MGTPFITIYDRFTMLANDYRLTALYRDNPSNFYVYMRGYLDFAIAEFMKICDQNLEDYSEGQQCWNFTMSLRNQVVLSMLIKKYWLSKVVDNVLQMETKVQDRDFKTYSEAQNLKEKKDELIRVTEDVSQMLIQYAYDNLDYQDLVIS